MMGFINFLKKRPSDKTILIGRMLFGIILVASLYYNLIVQGDGIESNFFWMEIPTESLIYIKYAFLALGIIPIIMGVSNICLLKKKWVRIIQVLFSLLLFYISSKIIPGNINRLDVDTLVWFMGLLPLFAGITGKCITTKCLKFGEKITKIRV